MIHNSCKDGFGINMTMKTFLPVSEGHPISMVRSLSGVRLYAATPRSAAGILCAAARFVSAMTTWQQKGIYAYLVRTQNCLFHFTFDEIYRCLLFFTLGRSVSAWIDYSTTKWNHQTQHQGNRPTWSPVYVHSLVCLAHLQHYMSC